MIDPVYNANGFLKRICDTSEKVKNFTLNPYILEHLTFNMEHSLDSNKGHYNSYSSSYKIINFGHHEKKLTFLDIFVFRFSVSAF